MKRIVSYMIAILLCFSAVSAYAAEASYTVDEVREQITSPWQATYETKWRTIEVDIQPTVPDVETMPVLMVRPAFWYPTTDANVVWSAEIGQQITNCSVFYVDAGDIWGEENIAKKGKKCEGVGQFFYAPLDMEKAYAPSNDLTITEMIETLQGILDMVDHSHFDIAPERALFIRVGGYIDKNTNEYVLPPYIDISIPTTLRGIPIYEHVITSIDDHSDFEHVYRPTLSFIMRSQNSFQLGGRTVYETNEIAADVPLCSFDAVREEIEQEIEEGHIRFIYSVDLGYALYNVPGARHKYNEAWEKDAEFYAVPTWRVVCAYSKQAKKELPSGTIENPEPTLYYKTLYVNAQTGMLIDPNDNRSGCGDYPGIITWEEVK